MMQANAGVSRSGRVRKKSAKLMEMEDFDASDLDGGGRAKKKAAKATSDDSEHERDKKVAPLKIPKGALATKSPPLKSPPAMKAPEKQLQKSPPLAAKSPPLAAAKSPPITAKSVTLVTSPTSTVGKPITMLPQQGKAKLSPATGKGANVNPPLITAKPPASAIKPSTVVAKPAGVKSPTTLKSPPIGPKTPGRKKQLPSPSIAPTAMVKKESATGKAATQQRSLPLLSSSSFQVPVGKTLVPIPPPKPTPAIAPTLFPISSKPGTAPSLREESSESSSSDDDSSNDDSDSDMDSDEPEVTKPAPNRKDTAWHLKIKGTTKGKKQAMQGNAASKHSLLNLDDDDSDGDTMDSLVIVENGGKMKKKLTKKAKVPKSKLKNRNDAADGTPKSFKSKLKGAKGKKNADEQKKRPMSAYMLWCQENRKKIVSQNPDMDFSQISKRLGEIWQSLPESEKMTWKRKAKKPLSKGSTIITTGKQTQVLAKGPVHLPPGSPLKSGDELSRSSYDGARVIGTTPLDVASHLKLLGESLSIIGQRLTEHEGQIAVSGSLSVLLDSALCALGPLLCLTSQSEEMNGCSQETLSQILDNVAYIMPGL